jgi:hypothetical protein
MKELRSFVVGLVVLVIVVNVLTGQGGAVAVFAVALLASIATHLQTVLIAVALPVLLLGGLIYVSPWHRDTGMRLMTGALAVLVVATVGPLFLHWLDGQLAAYGQRLFGGRP